MRILALTNLYPPHAYGGYEHSCRDALEWLAARGHEVTVATSTERRPGAGPDTGPIPVHRELISYFGFASGVALPLAARAVLGMERRNRRVLGRLLRDTRPDVVSVWHMGGMSMSLLGQAELAAPLVVVSEDEWLSYLPRHDPRSDRLRRGLPARLSAVTGAPWTPPRLAGAPVAFCSASLRDTVLADTPFPVDPHVVALGIDARQFPHRRPPDSPWAWQLLFVGRLDPRKGVETVIRALAALPAQATLRLLGGGGEDYRRTVTALVASLGLTGRVTVSEAPRSELSRHYAAADAVLFASEWVEPFGLVPLEAMCCGTPVVATRVGGAAEYLRDGENCLAFTPGDPTGLAEAVERLAGDRALRLQLRAGGLATAEHFTVARHAQRLEELLRLAQTAE